MMVKPKPVMVKTLYRSRNHENCSLHLEMLAYVWKAGQASSLCHVFGHLREQKQHSEMDEWMEDSGR